ncbi:MAG: methionyl-tRNA formyltransferase [Clostridia bacterium]|nr:methionyl-tRNA formyltransferase [Clostridia bacterium]
MKIAFLGTPNFANKSLEMLFEAGHELLVITQTDKPVGRKRVLTPPPVKVRAQELGLPVLQFERIRNQEGVSALKEFVPDLMVTAAYGQLLSQEVLDIPKYGCINVHASLLPKYRGAAPIQWAIINGESVTGVTTMMTELGLDSGDILLSQETEIDINETAGELFDRLADIGAQVLSDTIAMLENGTLVRVKQNESEATKCSMLNREVGKIDFSFNARKIHDLVRGTNPDPGAYALLDGETVKIFRTRLTDETADAKNGECVIADAKKGLFVKAGDGKLLEILEIQFAGSKRMNAKNALMGKQMLGKVLV